MSSYNAFAKFYDAAMRDVTEKVGFIKALIDKNSPEAKSVFELACGTGSILNILKEDFEVAGLDLSPEMVKIAQQKIPEIDIQEGDMTSFSLNKNYNVILCIFDSINHLPNWEGWQKVFEGAHKHLNENGLFIFDFNTIERLGYMADYPTHTTILGNDYLVTLMSYEDGVAKFDERVFEHKEGNLFELHQEIIQEISFPVNTVKEEVSKHFEILEIVNSKNIPEDDPNWRPFFVCKKK